jgi:uncharacterized membrane protein
MARWFSVKPVLTLKGRKFKGIRGLAGKPTHPPLTDIPIAAYIFAAAFDLIALFATDGSEMAHDFFTAGTYVLVGGVIVSVPTALTGFWDWLKSTPKHTQAWRTANTHMAIMLTVTALVVADIVIRWGDDLPVTAAVVLSVIVGGLVAIGATYGGSLVFDYGFNVETSGDHPVWHESETDVFPGDKHD